MFIGESWWCVNPATKKYNTVAQSTWKYLNSCVSKNAPPAHITAKENIMSRALLA